MPTAETSTRDRILDAAERLVHRHGFASTTVDAVIAAAPTSKGAFFHHFPTKSELGQALVARYARADAEVLEHLLRAAEQISDDPAEQMVELIRDLERHVDDVALEQPGCLFVSFLYSREQVDPQTLTTIVDSVELWRGRLSSRLRMAARQHPPVINVDLTSLADHVFTVLEGGFVLARATGETARLRAQLGHLRRYLALVFDVPAGDDPVAVLSASPESRVHRGGS